MAELIFEFAWVGHNRGRDYKTEPSVAAGFEAVNEAAMKWRSVLEQNKKNRHITVLQRNNGWWLIHAQREGTKSQGRDMRPVLAMFAGKLAGLPDCRVVAPLLKEYAKSCVKGGMAPDGLPEVRPHIPNSTPQPKAVAAAALSLIRGAQAVLPMSLFIELVPPSCPPAQWFDTSDFDWIALVESPLEDPLPGVGLTLIDRPTFEVPDSGHDPDLLHGLELQRLLATNATSEIRAALVAHELGSELVELTTSLDVGVLAWMADRPRLRQVAFDRVQKFQIGVFLGTLTYASCDELATLRDKELGHKPHGHRAGELIVAAHAVNREARQPFTAYHELFPKDETARDDLLPEAEQRAWAGMCGSGAAGDLHSDIDGLLARLRGTRVARPFTLQGLAWACANRSAEARKPFVEKLVEAGLPRPIADGAVLGTTLHCKEQARPALAPDWDWLRGVNPGWFFALYLGLSGSARVWWGEGLALLRDHKKLLEQDLYVKGVEAADPVLLGVGKALECVLQMADPSMPELALPPGDWPDDANPMIAVLLQKEALWRRFAAPVWQPGLDWLADRVPDPWADRLRQAREALPKCAKIDEILLPVLAPLLSNFWALGQIVHASRRPRGEGRNTLLSALIRGAKLDRDRSNWLQRRVIEGLSLPPMPSWTTPEMIALLPLLDPINDVVLVVLNRKVIDEPEEEKTLLGLVAPPANESQTPALPCQSEWAERRRDWVETLRSIFDHPSTK